MWCEENLGWLGGSVFVPAWLCFHSESFVFFKCKALGGFLHAFMQIAVLHKKDFWQFGFCRWEQLSLTNEKCRMKWLVVEVRQRTLGVRSDNEEKEEKEKEKRRKGRGGVAIEVRSNNPYLAGGKKNRNKEKKIKFVY